MTGGRDYPVRRCGPQYAAVWNDEAVDISRMEEAGGEAEEEDTGTVEEAESEPEEERMEEPSGVSYDVEEIMPEETEETQEKDENAFYLDEEEEAEKEEEPSLADQECRTGCRFRCTKIQRQDLSRLIRREWQLANNSFLLHGFHRAVKIHSGTVTQGNTFADTQTQNTSRVMRVFSGKGQHAVLRLLIDKKSRHNNQITFPILAKKQPFGK